MNNKLDESKKMVGARDNKNKISWHHPWKNLFFKPVFMAREVKLPGARYCYFFEYTDLFVVKVNMKFWDLVKFFLKALKYAPGIVK